MEYTNNIILSYIVILSRYRTVFGKLIRVKSSRVESSWVRIESNRLLTLHQQQLQQNKNTNMVLTYQKDGAESYNTK